MTDHTELKSDLEEHCGRVGVLAVNALEAQAAEIERLRAALAAQAPQPPAQPVTKDEAAEIFKQWREGPLWWHMAQGIEKLLASRSQPQGEDARDAALRLFDAAIASELPRVSHVEYDSHEICKHFADEVRKRLADAATKGER